MSKILLEEEWGADDIIEYANKQGIPIVSMQQEDIAALNPAIFMSMIPFCSTKITQNNLIKTNRTDKIPDTYPTEFAGLYKRDINKVDSSDIKQFPIFVKPVGNKKDFNGHVVDNKSDLPKGELYTASPVTFLVEYRMLIGNGKVYAITHQKGDKKLTDYSGLVDSIMRKADNRYYCVDIGYMKEINDWAIVEVNPPFALDDYGLDTGIYMTYCIDAYNYLKG